MSTVCLPPERWDDIASSLIHYGTQGDSKSAPMITGELCRAIGVDCFSPAADRRAAFLAFVFDAMRLNAAAQAARYASDRAQALVQSFEAFIQQHKDEITALQILYNRPVRAPLTDLKPAEMEELDALIKALGPQ